jgi:sugar phosphate isomerase/epimerase
MKNQIGGVTYRKLDLKSEFDNLKLAGYDFADCFLGLPILPDKEYQNKLDQVKNILPISVGHLPDIAFKNEEVESCKKFIEILSEINVKLFVIHLFSTKLPTKNNFSVKINGLKELVKTAEENNCILALENTEENYKVLKKVFDKIPKLFFCLDIGHANLFAKKNRSINLINNFKTILKHVHISDNFGGYAEKFDLHLPIGAGNIKFKPILNKLKEIEYSGNITLEIANSDEKFNKVNVTKLRKMLELREKIYFYDGLTSNM